MTLANKALALNPDSIDVLPVLAWSIPRSLNSKTTDGSAQLKRPQGYARHGIELLTALDKPAGLDDASFTKAKNEKLSMCYSGLGTADIKMGKYPEAAMELDQAVTLTADYPIQWICICWVSRMNRPATLRRASPLLQSAPGWMGPCRPDASPASTRPRRRPRTASKRHSRRVNHGGSPTRGTRARARTLIS